MARRWTWRAAGFGLLAGCLLLPSPAAEPADAFTPVATPAALGAVLRSNLKTLHDWLNDKDYTSAAETGQALAALAQLHGYQSNDAGWRQKAAALRA
ncbi:MAG TPA: hypothetical protein VFA26_03805, partial [Gemmataceae bacterium]|nr:hypothetical protein [Gemmataceae bacterium]